MTTRTSSPEQARRRWTCSTEVGQLDSLFVPVGGGGLLSGSALAVRAKSPKCRIYGVEPQAGNDGQRSFRSGEIVHIDTPKTIADGAQTQHLGKLTFAIIRRDVDDMLTADDAQLVECMRFFATRMKLIVEPTGCLGLAAARAATCGAARPARRRDHQRRQCRPRTLLPIDERLTVQHCDCSPSGEPLPAIEHVRRNPIYDVIAGMLRGRCTCVIG